MAAVHRYEGTVNQVMGDGIMALFGAPLAHEDHALRACYAALAMQDGAAALQRRGAAHARPGGPDRVGLNSGEVVVRAISNDLHMDYSAVGPNDPPGGPYGTARDAWHHPADRRHAASGGGPGAGQPLGPSRSRG